MKCRWTLIALGLVVAAPAMAAGVDIAWDDCLGESDATSLKAFACNTNVGYESLWVSFESSVPSSTMHLLEVAIQFQTRSGSPLPVWWNFQDWASCRREGLTVDPAPPYETPICTRTFTSANAPTFVVDRINYQFPSADVGTMVVAAMVGAPLVANQRYLACRFLLSHAKTLVCAGCSEPASVTVTGVHVDGVILTNPITNNVAYWQSLTTATRPVTWSALKRLYH